MSVESCGAMFARPERRASSNYAIGSDGRVAMYVEEKNRSWCSGNSDNDHQAITIEVANDGGAPDWHVSDKALAKLIDLCTDICKRNGISRLNFTGDQNGNLTMHNYFQATACPGPYLAGKFSYIASEVNKRLKPAAEIPAVVKPTAKTYTVKNGDSFWKIAMEQLGDGERWRELAAANGMNANSMIHPGDVLKLPSGTGSTPVKPTAKTYTVKDGDSFWKIATEQLGDGNRYKELAEANGMTEKSVIHSGDVLKLP
ncbi:peptidoglycan recognition protein family protein [Merdimmobilis hominis]|nr:LysM peptidoglycan-binding domain-containing protein [Merdimmobilis hominis]